MSDNIEENINAVDKYISNNNPELNMVFFKIFI